MKLNDYMTQRLSKCDQEDVCDDVLADAEKASSFGVGSDEEYGLYFRINHLIDELLEDTFDLTLEPEKLDDLKKFVFSHKDDSNYDLTSLVDLRILMYKWLAESKVKKAYPNIEGIYLRTDDVPVDKWIQTAHQMYNEVNAGLATRESAFKNHTQGWDRDEVFGFNNWLRYYEQKTPEKYNVKTANIIKTAFIPSSLVIPSNMENQANRVQAPFQANDGKTKKELDMEKAKSIKTKMKSRLRSLKALLDKYNDLLPHQSIDQVHDEIVQLEKSVGKLNAYAALEDRIIRSATKFEKLGFNEGALLIKEAVGLDTSDDTDIQDPKLKANVEVVINKLEGISKILKTRELVRELAKIDIMLGELGMGSFFPELTDALSKLIEGYSYSGNRIEGLVAKLRGSGKPEGINTDVKVETPKVPQPKVAPPTTPAPRKPAVELKPTQEKLEPSELLTATPPTPKPGKV